jgi:hypothetical protein
MVLLDTHSHVLPAFSARPLLHQPKDQVHVRQRSNAQKARPLLILLQKGITLSTPVQLSHLPVCLVSTRRQFNQTNVIHVRLAHLARLKHYLRLRTAGRARIDQPMMMEAIFAYHAPKARGRKTGD